MNEEATRGRSDGATEGLPQPLLELVVVIGGEKRFHAKARNNLTGTRELGNYDVDVFFGDQAWGAFAVEGFARGSTIDALLHLVMAVWLTEIDRRTEFFRERGEDLRGADLVYGGEAPAYVPHRDAIGASKILPRIAVAFTKDVTIEVPQAGVAEGGEPSASADGLQGATAEPSASADESHEQPGGGR